MNSDRMRTRSAAKQKADFLASSPSGIVTPTELSTPRVVRKKISSESSVGDHDSAYSTAFQAGEESMTEPSDTMETTASLRVKFTNPKKQATSKSPTKSGQNKRKTKTKKPATSTGVRKRKTTGKAKPRQKNTKKPQKRVLNPPASQPIPLDELPHNLGTLSSLLPVGENVSIVIDNTDKEDQPLQPLPKSETVIQQAFDETDAKPPDVKVKRNQYRLTPGKSPFPEWQHPTHAECEMVNELLTQVHGEYNAPKTIPEPSLTVTGCGEVPAVLDALIRTLLSGATTSTNSAKAFNGLVQRFGILEEGIGKGSVNWDAVRQAPLEDVFQAMKSGGLASIKSKSLKAILDMVHQENQERRNLLLSNRSISANKEAPVLLPEKAEKDKKYEIACADQQFLSLNHLHNLSKDAAMAELTKYPGIGPKTAACVILFCLQRPCFAVDTHIYRITKWLGWVPSTCSNEVTAFSHLEVRIPDHLKYSLHQLFIRHGRTCPRCRAITGETSAGWEEGCAIDHLVKRTGVRKPDSLSRKSNTTHKGHGEGTKKTLSKRSPKKKAQLKRVKKSRKAQPKRKQGRMKEAALQQKQTQEVQLGNTQFSVEVREDDFLQKQEQLDGGIKQVNHLTLVLSALDDGVSTDTELSEHSDSEFQNMEID